MGEAAEYLRWSQQTIPDFAGGQAWVANEEYAEWLASATKPWNMYDEDERAVRTLSKQDGFARPIR